MSIFANEFGFLWDLPGSWIRIAWKIPRRTTCEVYIIKSTGGKYKADISMFSPVFIKHPEDLLKDIPKGILHIYLKSGDTVQTKARRFLTLKTPEWEVEGYEPIH
ncbi:MAG: hypothetical protein GWO20_00630 [Candidatus Korarchaeota archaeon]|nr:hypothetical protein [Candidatus Korarchaeota archaeon]